MVPALAARLDRARAAGTPVVYVCDRHESIADRDFDHWPVHNLAGTDGAEVWPALAPKEGDRVVTKPAISGSVLSKLASVLDELRVDTLVITGCATEVQLMATATDALQLGYVVEVPADSQAGASAIGNRLSSHALGDRALWTCARRTPRANRGRDERLTIRRERPERTLRRQRRHRFVERGAREIDLRRIAHRFANRSRRDRSTQTRRSSTAASRARSPSSARAPLGDRPRALHRAPRSMALRRRSPCADSS